MYKYILWDFDGTLIDSFPEMQRMYKEILEEHNINANMNIIYDYMKRYSSVEVKEYIEKNYGIGVEEFHKEYSKKFNDINSINKLNFLNDSKETIIKLNELGIENFIVTNRNKSAVTCLENLNSINMFKEIVYIGLNGITKRKPDPEGINYIINKYNLPKEEILYVGDRDLDIKTTNNAGIDCAIYRPIEGYKLKAKYVINNFSELIEIVK